MMNDQNNAEKGPVRPQVIDLDAEEIRAEPEAPRPQADEALRDGPPPPAQERRGRGAALWILAALVMGLIGGGWLYREALSAYFPSCLLYTSDAADE